MKKEKDINQKAIQWWSDLTKSQQRNYEFKAYGYGEEFEDNSLCEQDYIDLYKKFANLNIVPNE